MGNMTNEHREPIVTLNAYRDDVEYEIRIYDDVEVWKYMGKHCCYSGPALRCPDVNMYEWWIDGKFILTTNGDDTNRMTSWINENNINLSKPEGFMAFKLRWL